jgi:hypothetical protein
VAFHGVHKKGDKIQDLALEELEDISLFQGVWMQKILITVLYYNNFNTFLI